MRTGFAYTIFILIAATIVACNSPYVSKKQGYFNIPLPDHKYQEFQRPGFPYSFAYPTYGTIVQDSTYFDNTPENSYWINIDFPQFDARLFLSYKEIGARSIYKVKTSGGNYRDSFGLNSFERMVNDAFTLTSKNEVVASYIKDSSFTTASGISGVFFKVGGNAATSQQFFLSDTTRHFLRGALYFSATPNADSLRPVQEFLHKDLLHFVETFRWKGE